LQHFAHRLDPVDVALFFDQSAHHFSWRSSCALEKKALASFSISLARRSSRFSRSGNFIRPRFSLVTPSRTLVLI
jgi:hypothetical protein